MVSTCNLAIPKTWPEVPAPSRPVAEASAAQAENKACDFLGRRRKYGLRDGGGKIETMSFTGSMSEGITSKHG